MTNARRPSNLAVARAWLSATSVRERLAMSFLALCVLVIAAGLVFSGARVGANIWRPGWICGESVKGGPFCIPDPWGNAGQTDPKSGVTMPRQR
jgi:hypothetical protein